MAGAERGDIDGSAAIWAGIVAGAVFLLLEMVMVPIFLGGSAWDPPRMIAAIVLGPDVLPAPDAAVGISADVLLAAGVVHFALSLLYALAVAWIVDRWPLGASIAAGAIFGVALYLVNFYGFTALFPWFAMARNWVGMVAHIAFGAVAGAVYAVGATPVGRAGEPERGGRMAAD